MGSSFQPLSEISADPTAFQLILGGKKKNPGWADLETLTSGLVEKLFPLKFGPAFFFFFFEHLKPHICFIYFYFWLCWVFVSVRGLSLVVASRGHSSSRCVGLSLLRPLLLRGTGSRCAGSVVVAHGPSCSAACGIFRPGLEPVSPVLAGRFSTTVPPGKPGPAFYTLGEKGNVLVTLLCPFVPVPCHLLAAALGGCEGVGRWVIDREGLL